MQVQEIGVLVLQADPVESQHEPEKTLHHGQAFPELVVQCDESNQIHFEWKSEGVALQACVQPWKQECVEQTFLLKMLTQCTEINIGTIDILRD